MKSKPKVLMFLSFFCILLLFINCKKSVTASGHVLDFFTGRGIADIEVIISETKNRIVGAGTTGTWMQTTGADGEFVIDYTGRRGGKYDYDITVPNATFTDTALVTQRLFIHMFHENSRPPVKWSGEENLVIEMAPAARIILLVRNPQNKPVDMISFSWVAKDKEWGMMSSQGGMDLLTVLCVPSNGQAILKVTFVSGGVTKVTTDTIPAKPFEITRHEIIL